MKKKFTIECEMEERWINHFCSMLEYMEHLGIIGSTKDVGICSDGDGDFRPKFNMPEFKMVEPFQDIRGHRTYDAG